MVRSYAKPIEFTLGAQTWLLDDQHCVRANCSCQESALSFFKLRPLPNTAVLATEPTLCIRYAYDTGQIESLSGAKDGRWSGQDFVDALKEVLPVRSRLGQAPSSVEAIVSPRPQPEDNPVAGTQTWSKRTLPLWQRQKV